MIAVELAVALGADLGVTSNDDLVGEIMRTAPAYAGLTQTVLHSDAAHDGIVMPVGGLARPSVTPSSPIDPMSLPGVESVERQGAPPRVGTAAQPVPRPLARAVLGSPPPLLVRTGIRRHRAAADPQGRQLHACAWWRGAGSTTPGARSPARRRSRRWCPTLVARANPYDLDRLGATTGDRVKVRSARGELILPAEADAGVPRGVVAIDFNVPGRRERAGQRRGHPDRQPGTR